MSMLQFPQRFHPHPEKTVKKFELNNYVEAMICWVNLHRQVIGNKINMIKMPKNTEKLSS